MRTVNAFAWLGCAALVLLSCSSAMGQTAPKRRAQQPKDFTEALKKMEELGHYKGTSVPGVDRTTLNNKVVVGYQGWHGAEGDGSGLTWRHYQLGGSFGPGNVCIDYWPDTSEFTDAEKFATPFKKADGSTAYVHSAFVPATVDRHFKWMKDYGIDAAFLQRFAHRLPFDPDILIHNNQVLSNVRAGANAHGRAWILMYDLSSVPADGLEGLKTDWKRLVDIMGVTKDPNDKAYLRHKGKPLVAVWGIGCVDEKDPKKRAFQLLDQGRFLAFLKNDPKYGGNTIMAGLPSGWRTLTRDAVNDPNLTTLINLYVDVISPWTPGRYRDLAGVTKHAETFWKPDMAWCIKEKKDYLPVVFPGFSWHNKKPDSPLDSIPRLGGAFLWHQFFELNKIGVKMVYTAMFDEMDEGTQIFKVDNDPPVGASPFLSYAPLPSDHYLWLVDQAGKGMFKGKPLSPTMPTR